MKKVTFVVIGEVSKFERKDAEYLEGREFILGTLNMAEINMAVKLRNIISEELSLQELVVTPMTDFMDEWNNDELKVKETFITYVHAIIEDKIKDENVNIAFGEAVVEAIQEDEYEKCADLITEGRGDIVGYNPRQDYVEELLEQLEGNTAFMVIDTHTLAEIDKFL